MENPMTVSAKESGLAYPVPTEFRLNGGKAYVTGSFFEETEPRFFDKCRTQDRCENGDNEARQWFSPAMPKRVIGIWRFLL